jgi:hypothetical protein
MTIKKNDIKKNDDAWFIATFVIFIVGVFLGSIIQQKDSQTNWDVYDNFYNSCIERELEIEFCQHEGLKMIGLEE